MDGSVSVAANKSKPDSGVIDRYMALIREKLPVVDSTLAEYGDMSVDEYLDVITKVPPESYQSSDDLADVVYEYAAPLLGEETAAQARDELKQSPVVLTANHHGVDYFAQSVQGTMIFSQRKLPSGQRARTVPVLACGSIPLNNLTYPRGILAYSDDSTLVKLPIFPKKSQSSLVCNKSSFIRDDINRVRARLDSMLNNGSISIATYDAVDEIISKYYSDEKVLNCAKYSDQATLVNAGLWDGTFGKGSAFEADLVYLQQEDIVKRLLEKDLEDSSSLAFNLMFSGELRSALKAELDNVIGCWNITELEERVNSAELLSAKATSSTGTFLFWYIDSVGRRVPLNLEKRKGLYYLEGVNEKNEFFALKFEPGNLLALLRDRKLIPSTFTAFLVLSFSRGITCLGGYYQAEYLDEYKRGLLHVLYGRPEMQRAYNCVAQVFSDGYLSGMLLCYSGRKLLNGGAPSGMVELFRESKSVNELCISSKNVSVYDAHVASIIDTLCDVCPRDLEVLDTSKIMGILVDYFRK